MHGKLLSVALQIIPGNEKRVMKMMNKVSRLGPKVAMSRTENLHASGHAYREELSEIIKLVKPQHFLPVHGTISLVRFGFTFASSGESVFLHAHAELAQELGVKSTTVIHDGELLGVKPLRTRRTVSPSSMQVCCPHHFR